MAIHHPDTATLMAYGAGTLPEAFSLLVAAHVEKCAECRAHLRDLEEMGGAIALAPCDISCDFDALMARIDAAPQVLPTPEPAGDPDIPAPLRRVISSYEDLRWRYVGPGVRKADLSAAVSGEASLFMLKINPGRAMPEHGHHGAEMTLILKGAYTDEFGRFGAGDIADHDADVEHTPVVDAGEPCICIVATDARARFKNPIARLFQPFAGI